MATPVPYATPAAPKYTPYPAPTPWINQPSAPSYAASQAIQASGSPQGFVQNPYYSQGGSNPQYASPADVAQVQQQSSQPYTPQINTGWNSAANTGTVNGVTYNDENQYYNAIGGRPQNSGGGSGLPQGEAAATAAGYDWNSPQFADQRARVAAEIAQIRAQQEAALRQQEQANIEQATHEYDYLRQQLEGRKGDLQASYDTGNRDLDAQMQQTQGTYIQNRSDLEQNYNQNKGDAYQNYQTTQRKNRELARSLGSGTSSAYLDMQGAANNAYTTADARMGTDFSSRMAKLDTDWSAANQYAQNQKSTLAQQLQSGMRAIVLDQNATDFRKADAINQLRAQARTQMAQIDASLNQFQQQLAMQKQQLDSYAQMYNKTSSGANYASMIGIPAYTSSTGQDLSSPVQAQRMTGGLGASADDTKKSEYGLGNQIWDNFAWAGNAVKKNLGL